MLVALAVAWIAVGAVLVLVMHRRGHDVFSWSLLFLVLGPLAVPLAVSSERHVPPEPPSSDHDGRLDVLVAHDGSAEASAALDAAVTMFGTEMTSLTLAAVVSVEATTTVQGRAVVDEAQARLDEVARRVASAVGAPVDTIVLHGPPAEVLERFAREHAYEVIVVGSRPRRTTHVGARDVSKKLSAGASVPVLVGPSLS